MKLMSVTLEGYKRSEQCTEIDVAGNVIALVGPNEAGKSSILQALASFDNGRPFSNRETTRRSINPTSVALGFILDDDDRWTLGHIPGGSEVRWWKLEKGNDGKLYCSIHPTPPKRDLRPRQDLGQELQKFKQVEHLDQIERIGKATVQPLLISVLEVFRDDEEDLTDQQLGRVHRLVELLLSLPDVDLGAVDNDYQSDIETRGISLNLRRFLERIEGYDEGRNPLDRLGALLIDMKPPFLLFTEGDRELRSTYELSDDTERRGPALRNLADLAGLDLDELLEVAVGGDPGRRVELLDLANIRLRDILAKSWKQSDLTVRLDIQETELQIYVSIPGGGYSQIEERSSGLLSFVALRSFLAKQHPEHPPILLVDEAETHLHYDAQADMVNLFSDQDLASKVIYTTHSAGCLPRDLGTGIRVVMPLEGKERSTVKKSVWEGSAAGFSPLIYGMGATTFAFLPARHVLLTEGQTDAMLLPTLFREATGLNDLPFQIAPGLSSVSRASMVSLTSEGGSVAFLTDGDKPGETLRQRLSENGVPSDRLFGLSEHTCDGTVLEDLLSSAVYAQAVSDVIRDFQEAKSVPSIEVFPDTGRPNALKTWCKHHKLSVPDKKDVAQRLLDMKSASAHRAEEVTLLDEKHREGMNALYQGICSMLGEEAV